MRALSISAIALVALSPAIAGATPPNGADWVARSGGAEAAVAAASVASLGTFFLPQRHGAWAPMWERKETEPYDLVSDVVGDGGGTAVLALTGLAFDSGYFIRNGAAAPLGAAARDTLVDLEAAALATGITLAIKRAVGRCRPRGFVGGHCSEDDADYDAFPSGHSSPVAALSGSRFVMAMRSDGPSGLRWGSFAMSETFTVATMGLRILAGAHSWEDVLGGWAIGTTTGLLIALAHPMRALPIDAGSYAIPSGNVLPARVVTWEGRF